ncbi:MAG TPA: dienelactone hydrolase family protein [Terriglobales bacterium]|nr:dienelactone hydrolase family protein [Terriglobales bacterium]
MKCAPSSFLTASVLLILALIVPLASAGQVIATVDPDAASSKSLEDISNAALSGSQMHADPPIVLEKAENKDFTREFIAVQWRPADRIYLFVVLPKNVQKPPVAIYLYGHPSDTDRFMDDGWCRRTTSGGYAAVGLVPALTGHRYHDRPMKQWFVSELQEALGKSAHDVQMVLNYLAERGDVDMTNVGMFGVGAGGTIAVMTASVDPRIKAIDLLDPWGDWPVWTQKSAVIPEEERPAYVKPEFLKEVADFDPVKLLPGLKTPHVRLNQLDDDVASTPEEAKKQMEAALPATAEHHRFATSAQFFSEVASGGRVFDWLKAQIKANDPKVRDASKETLPGAGSGSGK